MLTLKELTKNQKGLNAHFMFSVWGLNIPGLYVK